MDHQPSKDTGATRVVFCERQKLWLPIGPHVDCDFCAAPVYDEDDQPVSLLCTECGERKIFQPEHVDESEEGYGPPSPKGV
jgi:hypothetical protein